MLKIMVERMQEDGRSEVDNFKVKLNKGMTVLAVLETIYRERDPTIAFRFSCKTGLCATCSMMINHKPGLSCLKSS
jgi:succinate dehydrogenase/fumarate reductase-like Fe-S protein